MDNTKFLLWQPATVEEVTSLNDFEEDKWDRLDEFLLGMSDLLRAKDAQYGPAFAKSGEILKVLFPDGIPVEKYKDLLTITRITDKLFRVANRTNDDEEAPWADICGYAALAKIADGEPND